MRGRAANPPIRAFREGSGSLWSLHVECEDEPIAILIADSKARLHGESLRLAGRLVVRIGKDLRDGEETPWLKAPVDLAQRSQPIGDLAEDSDEECAIECGLGETPLAEPGDEKADIRKARLRCSLLGPFDHSGLKIEGKDAALRPNRSGSRNSEKPRPAARVEDCESWR